ncbi:MAG: type I secretion system permease/ATPase [Betaproteobacteria bacterium]|nr:MAG: type I secretion system permease/ATPase [Betaproteobacteria bacterium]
MPPKSALGATNTKSALREALAACRSSFFSAGFFSLFINLLLLLPAIYMLQVYDRVLTSSSESTLLMLTLIAAFLFIVMGALEWVRSQILVLTGTRLDRLLGARVFDSVFLQTLTSGGRIATAQPLADLLQLRQFLTGQGLFAFFDAPWLPIYIAVMFLFHPAFGVVAIISAVVLLALTIWNELATREDLIEANRNSLESSNQTQRNLRNAEVIEAMGMLPRMRERWQERQNTLLALQSRASRKAGLISAASRTFRITVQTLVLGLGAYLAIGREITPGVVIAGSILLGRALAPLDLLINSWRGFLGAREAYQRLDALLAASPQREPPMPLPAPKGEVSLEKLVVTPPGAVAPVIKGVSLLIEPGTMLAVIGPSAAGKSTLVRSMLGLYRPTAGSVRLDGAELEQWDREALGRYVGYLPQDVELLDGTISENIARFGTIDAQQVVAAAQAAGVHEMILRLPEGYDTRLVGNVVSAGQRQRIGIARALYGEPRFIVLDEPNSNLDQEGDAALAKTLAELKRAGRTVVVVTHRRNVLQQSDRVLLMAEGQIAVYGNRDQVLAALRQAASRDGGAVHPPPPATTISQAR